MEEERRKIYIVVAVIGLVAVLFSCIFGAMAGGVAGFLTGQRQGEIAAQRTLEGSVGSMPWVEEAPWPQPRPDVEGALVVEVVADTPAAEAGLQAGDIITAIDHTPIDANHDLADIVQQYQPGDRVTIHFLRRNAAESVRVELGTDPDNARQPYLGVYFRALTGPDSGAPND